MNILNKLFVKQTEKSDVTENHKAYYNEYLQYLNEHGWNCSTVELSKLSSVTTMNLEKDMYGSFLDIRCPAGKKIVFVGLSNVNLDVKHFSKYPNLYRYPYSFSITCKDNNNIELSYDKMIKISKVKESESIIYVAHELYGDLNLNINERVKKLNERFYFKEGFELNDEEHLILETRSDINIRKIEVLGKVDLFTKI